MFFVETFKLSFRYYKQMNIDPLRKPYSSAGARSTRYQIQQYWCVVCTPSSYSTPVSWCVLL